MKHLDMIIKVIGPLNDYTDEIGHQFQMKSAIVSGGNKAS